MSFYTANLPELPEGFRQPRKSQILRSVRQGVFEIGNIIFFVAQRQVDLRALVVGLAQVVAVLDAGGQVGDSAVWITHSEEGVGAIEQSRVRIVVVVQALGEVLVGLLAVAGLQMQAVKSAMASAKSSRLT